MKSVYYLALLALLTGLLTVASCSKGSEEEAEMSQKQETVNQTNKKNSNAAEVKEEHKELQNNFAHRDILILKNPYQPSESTKKELIEVINAYLKMKDAFVNDNAEAADAAASDMEGKIKSVKPEKMSGEGLEAWQQHDKLYSGVLKDLERAGGLQEKRSYFSHVSEIIYCTIKSFDLKKDMKKLYAIFCPMAFDGKGAYWISDSPEIKNPYFGEKMLNCGEVKEEL